MEKTKNKKQKTNKQTKNKQTNKKQNKKQNKTKNKNKNKNKTKTKQNPLYQKYNKNDRYQQCHLLEPQLDYEKRKEIKIILHVNKKGLKWQVQIL